MYFCGIVPLSIYIILTLWSVPKNTALRENGEMVNRKGGKKDKFMTSSLSAYTYGRKNTIVRTINKGTSIRLIFS